MDDIQGEFSGPKERSSERMDGGVEDEGGDRVKRKFES